MFDMPACDSGRKGLPGGWRLVSAEFDTDPRHAVAVEKWFNGKPYRQAVRVDRGLVGDGLQILAGWMREQEKAA